MADPENPQDGIELEQLITNFIFELRKQGFVANMNIADLEKQVIVTVIATMEK